MLTTLLTTAVVAAAGLLPIPLPLPLPVPTDPGTAQVDGVAVSGVLDAPDGRLKRGCKDYGYAYSVTTGSDDWTFDITLRDRSGKGVNAQSLIGPNDDKAGVLPFRLCRWATRPGRFTLTGVVVAYDGSTALAEAQVTETFRLRRRNR